jgi:thermitase
MRTVPRRSTLALIAAAVAALAAPSVAAADEGQIIVKYAAGADAQERADARADADVVAAAALPLAGTQVVAPEPGTSVAEAVADLERSPDVAYAEPDQPRTATAAPDDADFAWQWSLQNSGSIFNRRSIRPSYTGTAGDDIDILPAWDQGLTKSDVTVGVVDSGVDLAHPDLTANLLSSGHDYVDGDNTPSDQNGHGTHVAGIIGAVGDNGIGVAGVAWKASILPVRVLNASGSGSVSTVVNGYNYAASRARIVNVSLGGDSPSQTEYDALRNASNTLFVVAAGNDGVNVDTTDSYPCAYDLPNVLCVAATGADDQLASFSDYGATAVDLAAPGVDILSTYPTALSADRTFPYKWLSGTSMATPEVTGAAALVLDQDPSLTPWQLREKLTTSAEKVPALEGKVASGGRLDVAAALAQPAPTDAAPNPSSTAPAARGATTPVAPAPPTTPATPAPTTPAPAAPQPAPAAVPATTAPATSAPATTAPATTPVASAGDRTAPTVALSLSTRGALTALLKGRLRVKTSVSERASVRVDVRLDARTAKKLHLKATKTGVRIATGRATATRAGTTTVTLKLTSAAKRALARARSVKATLKATATDAAGNRGARGRTLTIKR